MEEEISLREIIEKLWNGKWIISVVTIIALIISVTYSFFIADPVYKGGAKVTIHKVASIPKTVQPYITELTKPAVFEQTMKSPDVIANIIERNNLEASIGSLQSRLQIEIPGKGENASSFISISMEGVDKEKIETIIDSAITITKDAIKSNIQTRLTSLSDEYQMKMTEEDERITSAVAEFNEMGAGEGLPSLILFQQNAAGSQYVLEVNEDLLNELRNLDKRDQIRYEKINNKIQNLTSLYNFYSSKYDEVRSVSSMNIIDLSMKVVSNTFVPDAPVAPNKMLNVAIAIVLGLMLGVGIVFLREYMRSTDQKKV